jgi:hemolysin type calcium-binding protein
MPTHIEKGKELSNTMRRVALLLMVVSTAVLLASGVALAAAIAGTNGNDTLIGTNDRDTISGAAGDDYIAGLDARDSLYGDQGADEVHGNGGNDQLFPGQGADESYGGRGDNDFINAIDEKVDSVINCGPGQNDEAYTDIFPGTADPQVEFNRAVRGGCENVSGVSITPQQADQRAEGVALETLTPGTPLPDGVTLVQVYP